MIEMRVRNDNRVDLATVERAEIWRGFVAFALRMHSGVEHQPAAVEFDPVRIRADLGVAGEVGKLHGQASGGVIATTLARSTGRRSRREKIDAAINSQTAPIGRNPGSQRSKAAIAPSASRQ